MNAPIRVGAFAAVAAVAFGGAALAGQAIDTIHDDPTPAPHGGMGQPGGHGAEAAAHGAMGDAHAPAGLAVAAAGLRLQATDTTLPRDRERPFSFRIRGADGAPLRSFGLEHERRMHLIVVRRDLTGYQHLHPRMASDGTWSVGVRLPEAGVYRAYADFTTGGQKHTLAIDLHVAGPVAPIALPEPTPLARAGESAVTLDTGEPRAGSPAELTFSVSAGGRPVDDLEPYLGARGHLVALREGDLAYLHVHPEDASAGPGEIVFGAIFPSAGRYRLFLQFQREGAVQTVAHTVEVTR